MYAPLIKYGLSALGVGALVLGLIWYGAHRKQLEWDASLTKQALESAKEIVAQAENTANVEVGYIHAMAAAEGATQRTHKEVIRYVEGPAKKCVVTPEFERAFDLVSRLHDPSAIGVSPSDAPSGESDAASSPALTDVAVLRAYQHAVVELHELWTTYAALVEWVRTSHELAHE